jgi:hypothetical protein
VRFPDTRQPLYSALQSKQRKDSHGIRSRDAAWPDRQAVATRKNMSTSDFIAARAESKNAQRDRCDLLIWSRRLFNSHN